MAFKSVYTKAVYVVNIHIRALCRIRIHRVRTVPPDRIGRWRTRARREL